MMMMMMMMVMMMMMMTLRAVPRLREDFNLISQNSVINAFPSV